MEETKMECEHCEELFGASELERDSIGRMVCRECKAKIEEPDHDEYPGGYSSYESSKAAAGC